MKARDVMTRRVITATTGTTLEEAARLMLHHRISALPVVDGKGRCVGLISEGDLLRRAEIDTERHRPRWLEFIVGPGRLAQDYAQSHTHRVGDVMTAEIVPITPQTDLETAVELMERHRIKRLPVIDRDRLVGIVSRADLLRAFASVSKSNDTVGRAVSDTQIRRGIHAEIDRQPWAPRAAVRVSVKQGVVELHGTITDERERRALRVIAENFPGVIRVDDQLIWIEPVSGMVLESIGPRARHGE